MEIYRTLYCFLEAYTYVYVIVDILTIERGKDNPFSGSKIYDKYLSGLSFPLQCMLIV